jgi:hypothetical protein
MESLTDQQEVRRERDKLRKRKQRKNSKENKDDTARINDTTRTSVMEPPLTADQRDAARRMRDTNRQRKHRKKIKEEASLVDSCAGVAESSVQEEAVGSETETEVPMSEAELDRFVASFLVVAEVLPVEQSMQPEIVQSTETGFEAASDPSMQPEIVQSTETGFEAASDPSMQPEIVQSTEDDADRQPNNVKVEWMLEPCKEVVENFQNLINTVDAHQNKTNPWRSERPYKTRKICGGFPFFYHVEEV